MPIAKRDTVELTDSGTFEAVAPSKAAGRMSTKMDRSGDKSRKATPFEVASCATRGFRKHLAALTRAAALGLSVLLSGCVSLPPLRSASCDAMSGPPISISADGNTASMRLDVLTYNIEGLPGLIRTGRPAKLREIASILADLRRRAQAPDVVMFQEVFSRSARNAVLETGYPTLAPGPSVSQRQPRSSGPRIPGRQNLRRGELGLKFASSGLVIATEFPLVASGAQPFGRNSCAGIDCLSNKGVAMGRVLIPGLPVPLDLYTTHMNSTGASRVGEARHLAAHARQAVEIGDFIRERTPPWIPIIFAGDFNMRAAPARFETFEAVHEMQLVHVACLTHPDQCEVGLSWDGDAPWLDTQDLQFFASSSAIRVRPVRVEAMFDGSPGSPRLSDHDGLRVVYELSWPAAMSVREQCSGGGR